jgi:hypothetical protein|tara:strand:+ start:7316 stop:8425 length:1110 start_codon:yes stop_codon:yes gene_type:complete
MSVVVFIRNVGDELTSRSSVEFSKMSSQQPQLPHPLTSEIAGFIASNQSEGFDELMLRLFTHQFEKCLPYRQFARSLGVEPTSITYWREIPAIPTSAFKLANHPLSSGATTFLTSGTTTEIKGAHHFPSTTLYDLAALTHWKSRFPDLPLSFLSPPPEENPSSSLVHMFEQLHQSLDPQNTSPFLLRNDQFHLAPLFQLNQPVILSGTALAFLHLLKSHQAIPLPKGSRLLETGGYKGTTHSLSKPNFYAELSTFFSVPDHDIHNEYGMTELSSQAYTNGADGTHRFPDWCRFQIICPETGKELSPGAIGYLQIHDLANLHSVAAIRTQDFASAHPDGSFTLLGRDPGALPRGCSRSIDDSLSPNSQIS